MMKNKLLLPEWIKVAPLLCGAGVLLSGAPARADAPNPQLQKTRMEVLAAGQKGAAALPMLAEAMKNSNALIRRAAIRSLAQIGAVGSSRVDLQACKLEYSIVSPK